MACGSTPSFVHRYRPLSNRELGYLMTHLHGSGTSFEALAKFAEAIEAAPELGPPWVIPLPGNSNLYYVIGDPPEGYEPIPTQLNLLEDTDD